MPRDRATAQRNVNIAPLGEAAADRALRGAGALLLARAFQEEPHLEHLFPADRARARLLPAVFGALLRDAAAHGRIEAAWHGSELAGLAVWFPPGAMPPPLRRQLRALPELARVLLRAPRSMRRLMQFASAAGRHRPAQPYWYLAAVGVDPALRRRGIATRLLSPVLVEAAAAGVDCYLETHTPRHVAWYARLGFAVREAEVAFTPGGPPNWTMIRRGDSDDV